MNEPVAWMNAHGQFNKKETWLFPIPLYTHPAKTLTDEEIAEIAMQCSDMDEYGNSQLKEYEFARAILRKAQENG